MDKVKISDLNLVLNENVEKVVINNGVEVYVRQYIPVEERLEIISNVLMNCIDGNNFVSPTKENVFFDLEMIVHCTNLDLPDDMNPNEIYDLLESNGVFNAVYEKLPIELYESMLDDTHDTIESYFKYQNSALGILEKASTDYSDLNFDATEIKDKIANPANLELLKEVINKLG